MADNGNTEGAIKGDKLMLLFDLEKSRFYELGKKGILVRVGPGLYNAPQSIRNYIKHLREIAAGRSNDEGIDIVAEGARLKKVQADKAEYQLAIMRGEYLPSAEIDGAMQGIIIATQSAVLGTTATAAKDLGLDRSQTTRLDEIHREALKNLAQSGDRIAKEVEMRQASAMALENEPPETEKPEVDPDQQGFDFGEDDAPADSETD